MNVREKLIGMIAKAKYICANDYSDHTEDEYIADTLLDNGVTVQQWIPVTERLPQKDGYCLVTINYFGNHQGIDVRYFAKDGETVDEYDLAGQKDVWCSYDSEWGYVSTDSVTHWMPLPELPKGE